MHASGDLWWYLAGLLWFFAVRGWYVVEGTTLPYDRNIGDDSEAVPTDRYYQDIRSGKEVRGETSVNSTTTHRPSGDDMSVIHNPNLYNDNGIGFRARVPMSTTSSYYQDRSIGKEAVLEQNDTAPATLSDQRVIDDEKLPMQVPKMIGIGTTPWYNRENGKRGVRQKIETSKTKTEGGTAFKTQDVIKGITSEYRSNNLLEGTTEHGERKIADNAHTGEMENTTIEYLSHPSSNVTSQDATVSGRKIKMPRPNSQTMQYLLVPGFLMAGILPWVMPKLQMVAMLLSMVNNMAFTSALFTLIRNFIFDRESAQHVLYVNNGYRKKNGHRNNGNPHKVYQGHAPIHYEHQEYHEHPPGLDHLEHSASQAHHEYQTLQEPPPIGWEGQGSSKVSETWRKSSNTS